MNTAERIVNKKYMDLKILLERYKMGLITEDEVIKEILKKIKKAI